MAKKAGQEGALIVVAGKDGAPYWEGKWRRDGRQVKRRLGPAFLDRRDPGSVLDPAPMGDGWRFSWSEPITPTGRLRSSPDERLTLGDAHAALALKIEEVDREREEARAAALAGDDGGPVLFGQVVDEWITERNADVKDGHLKGSTMRDYKGMLRREDVTPRKHGAVPKAWVMREFGARPAEDITGDDVTALLDKMRDSGLSSRTRSKYAAVLSMLFDFGKRAGYVDHNVMTDRPRAKRKRRASALPRVYSIETVELIAVEAGEFADIVRTAALTGLRQGELLGLRWRDVDWLDRRSITVRTRYLPGEVEEDEEDTPKSNRARTVPLSDQAAVVLDRVSKREHFRGDADLVFPNDVGGHLDPSTLRNNYAKARDTVIKRSAKKGDQLPEVVFHGLRHTFGSRCAAAGVPLATIMAWMGHADITTTMIYVHWQPQHDDADRLSRAFATTPTTADVEQSAEVSS
jgi:integrase